MSLSHLADIIQKQLKRADDKINDLEWNTIKRSPQYFKQRARLGTNTVDIEFNAMKEVFDDIETAFKRLGEEVESLKANTVELIKSSETIANTTKLLLEPETDNFQHTYRVWQNINFYSNVMNLIAPEVQLEYDYIEATVQKYIGTILATMKTIRKRIQGRNYALLDHDKIYNQYDNLLLAQATRELTIKEAPQVDYLKRKSDASIVKYQQLNDSLKGGLPAFFELVRKTIEPLQLIIFCAQWMGGYQMMSQSLDQVFQGEIREVESSIKDLRIFDIDGCKKESGRTSLDEVSVTAGNYCKAIFTFNSQQPGDIDLKHGDVIKIISKDGNWWTGEIDGKTGRFPWNYVESL